MKKISILSLLALFISFTGIHAQITKGSVFLGGTIGGSTQKTQTDDNSVTQKQNGIIISPVFGKAIKENLIVGADAGIAFLKNDYTATQGFSNTQKGAVLWGRCFLKTI